MSNLTTPITTGGRSYAITALCLTFVLLALGLLPVESAAENATQCGADSTASRYCAAIQF
ncbi:hypothetical protein [Jannaschia sp. 2305UL9-9]|uniref:hypothetical protein n=1 Tax=Jannaschia sp. 2305UL9-9 TaxID=3121638 RepID=UPI003527C4B6